MFIKNYVGHLLVVMHGWHMVMVVVPIWQRCAPVEMAAANRKREAKQSQRENFVDIKVKTKEVLQDRKKINHLIDLQAYIEVCLRLFIFCWCIFRLVTFSFSIRLFG